jgi:shikimate dehydrogenase
MQQRAGLIGDPVDHSRSPAMHNAAFAHLGLDARYELWSTPAAALAERITSLRDSAVLGANVTLPHKTAVIPFLDALEDEALQIGAVNTIYKHTQQSAHHASHRQTSFPDLPENALIGANTDAPALLEDLREAGGFEPEGQPVVLLGASGAARAAAYALVNAGVAQLVVANRTLERAEELLADVLIATTDELGFHIRGGPPARLIALALDDPDLKSYIAESRLLINATSLGWHAGETPLSDPPLGPGMLVYDMVYQPTWLLHEATARGARTLDGLGMLVRQGALAFSRWTGCVAPIDVMRASLMTG